MAAFEIGEAAFEIGASFRDSLPVSEKPAYVTATCFLRALRERTMPQTSRQRWIWAGVCIFLALVFLQQFLGLLFNNRVLERAVTAEGYADAPFAVRLMGLAADKVHNRVLAVPLHSRGSVWPRGFRLFFILELCGFAGLSIAMAKFAGGIIKQRADWMMHGRSLLVGSCVTIIMAVCLLKLIR